MSENDIFDLSDLGEKTPTDIKKRTFFQKNFGLKWNPFPEVGVPTSDINGQAVIRNKEIKKILEVIRKCVEPPYKRQAVVIQGAYGSGKSFLLKKIVAAINKSSGRQSRRSNNGRVCATAEFRGSHAEIEQYSRV